MIGRYFRSVDDTLFYINRQNGSSSNNELILWFSVRSPTMLKGNFHGMYQDLLRLYNSGKIRDWLYNRFTSKLNLLITRPIESIEIEVKLNTRYLDKPLNEVKKDIEQLIENIIMDVHLHSTGPRITMITLFVSIVTLIILVLSLVFHSF